MQIGYLSYNSNDEKLKSRSENIVKQFLQQQEFEWTDELTEVMFVASGGSEKGILKIPEDQKHVILLCHREENSFAAAMEIAAWLRSEEILVQLIDVYAAGAHEAFLQVKKVFTALSGLQNQRAALIGEVSDWLIVSDVKDETVFKKFGIQILRLPWEHIGDHHSKNGSSDFLKYFPQQSPDLLKETSKVYELLEEVVEKNQLSAVSVECFSMVMRDQVTACLPLAVFNAQNKVAACEGDMVSMIGKMLIRELTGKIPWQANIAEIKEDTILLAHCTAPLNAIESFDVTTHFETGVGTAIKGKFEKKPMAIFRLDNELNRYMLIEGEITETPSHSFACRTQIELTTTKDQTELLKNKSLGNHHLVFPVDQAPLLNKMMEVLGIERIDHK